MPPPAAIRYLYPHKTAKCQKNWLFIGEAQADQRGAILYTVIEACRRRGIDPFEYLRDVFTRMPAMAACDYHRLLPDAWAKGGGMKVRTRSQAICRPNSIEPTVKRCA